MNRSRQSIQLASAWVSKQTFTRCLGDAEAPASSKRLAAAASGPQPSSTASAPTPNQTFSSAPLSSSPSPSSSSSPLVLVCLKFSSPPLNTQDWCGFGLRVDETVFSSPSHNMTHNIWSRWEVAFHGTKVATASEILHSADWQLQARSHDTVWLRTSSYQPWAHPSWLSTWLPSKPNLQVSEHTVHVLQLPLGVHVLYCDTVEFESHRISVAFQLRQEPGTYDGNGRRTSAR